MDKDINVKFFLKLDNFEDLLLDGLNIFFLRDSININIYFFEIFFYKK